MNVNYLECLQVNVLTDALQKIKVEALIDSPLIFTPTQKHRALSPHILMPRYFQMFLFGLSK